jgi:integrase
MASIQKRVSKEYAIFKNKSKKAIEVFNSRKKADKEMEELLKEFPNDNFELEEREGKTTYYVVYRDTANKQIRKKAGHKKIDADQLQTKVENDLYGGTYIKSGVKFGDLKERFIKSHKKKVRARTMEGYKQRLDYAVSYFGNKEISEITPSNVEDYLDYLEAEGKSPSTSEKYLKVLKLLFNKAVKWELVAKNPALNIDPPLIPKKEMDFLSPEEIELLVDNTIEEHKCLMIVACYSGIRRGELLGLRWDDVDFNSIRIFIRRTLEPNKRQFLEPKTDNSKRAVTVPFFVMDKLKEHQIRQLVDLPENKESLIFPNELGKPMEHRNLIRRIFEPALTRAGLRKVRFHDLRHSYAAALISAGENPKWIQKQLGHSSIMVTMDTYGHLLPDIENNASARLEKALKPSLKN